MFTVWTTSSSKGPLKNSVNTLTWQPWSICTKKTSNKPLTPFVRPNSLQENPLTSRPRLTTTQPVTIEGLEKSEPLSVTLSKHCNCNLNSKILKLQPTLISTFAQFLVNSIGMKTPFSIQCSVSFCSKTNFCNFSCPKTKVKLMIKDWQYSPLHTITWEFNSNTSKE